MMGGNKDWTDELVARCDDCGAEVLGSTLESLEQWRERHAEQHAQEIVDPPRD